MTFKPTNAQVEAVARIVYDTMGFDRKIPPWTEGGNSFAQDEARRAARKIIELVHPAA